MAEIVSDMNSTTGVSLEIPTSRAHINSTHNQGIKLNFLLILFLRPSPTLELPLALAFLPALDPEAGVDAEGAARVAGAGP